METLKNKNYKFNLITEKWITVLTEEGVREYSIKEVFENAENIERLFNEDSFIDYSIYNILLAILYTAYSRDENYRDMEQEDFEYDKSVVLKYLLEDHDKHGKKIYDLFNLYDEERPFLQIKKDVAEKQNRYLCYRDEIKNIENLSLFKRRGSCYQRKMNITNKWIIKHLLSYRVFNTRKNTGAGDSLMIDENVLIKSGILPFYYFNNNLVDFFRLNYMNSWSDNNHYIDIRPEWEIDYSTEWEQAEKLNIIYETYKEKEEGNKKIIRFRNLFCKEDDSIDVARFLTYSNVILYIENDNENIKNSKFIIGSNIQLNRDDVVDKTISGKKAVYEIKSKIKNSLNFIQSSKIGLNFIHSNEIGLLNSSRNAYIKLQLSDPSLFQNQNIVPDDIKYINIYKLPEYDKNKACVHATCSLMKCFPVKLINNILYCSREEYLKEDKKLFYNLKKEIEDIQGKLSNFKKCVEKNVTDEMIMKNKTKQDKACVLENRCKNLLTLLNNEIDNRIGEYYENFVNDNFKDISICEQEKGKLFNYIKKILDMKRTEFQKTYTSNCFWNEILENEKTNRKQVKEVKQIKTRKGKKNT